MVAWVTRPERPKGAKDEVKRPEGPPTWSRGPEGLQTSSYRILLCVLFKTADIDLYLSNGFAALSGCYCFQGAMTNDTCWSLTTLCRRMGWFDTKLKHNILFCVFSSLDNFSNLNLRKEGTNSLMMLAFHAGLIIWQGMRLRTFVDTNKTNDIAKHKRHCSHLLNIICGKRAPCE